MKAKLRDTEIYFDVDGMGLLPEDGSMVERPVVFVLHGGPGGDHSSFKSQTTADLRDVAQLVFVDHRGSGRSAPANPGTYTLDHNIEDLEALRQYLGLERISILGSSYGGMVAQGYAVRYPRQVANLVLVATAPSFRFIDDAKQLIEAEGTPEQQRVCEWLWEGTFQSQEQLYEFYQTMGPRYATTFDAGELERGWKRGIRNFEQLNLGFNGFLRSFDFTGELPVIDCPTLVLGGAHDWICAPHHSRLIADLIPRTIEDLPQQFSLHRGR